MGEKIYSIGRVDLQNNDLLILKDETSTCLDIPKNTDVMGMVGEG